MRKCFILVAVGALLCAMGFAQSATGGQSNNSQQSEALPADAQPVNAPAPTPVPQISLGDYARQLRLKKQQHEAQLQQAKENKEKQDAQEKQTPAPETQSADVKPAQPADVVPKPQMAAATAVEQRPTVPAEPQPNPQPKSQIVTTAAVPARATVTTASVHQTISPAPQSQPVPSEAQVRAWKAEIQQQKSLVASLQKDILDLNNSIHLAGGNCIANCDQWNDRQKRKQQDLETLKAQLQEQQSILAEMLEAERVLIPQSAQNSQ